MSNPSGLLTFTENERAVLQRLVDIVIPEDQDPGGWAGGVGRLLEEHVDGFLAWAVRPLKAAVSAVDAVAERDGSRFLGLPAAEQEQIVRDLDAAERLTAPEGGLLASTDPTGLGPIAALRRVCFEGFYGGTREPSGWRVAGFRAVPEGVETIEPAPLPEVSHRQLRDHYDVIVIGAGAGGGAAAAELAEAGRQVLLIERARTHTSAELRGNHLQGKRPGIYDIIAGPGAGSPRVLELDDGSTRLLPGNGSSGDYGLVAMTVGGGTRVWQGMSWRFFPEDFRMATEYGSPDDSTLADWPFDYDELAPYYDRAEWELGVAGSGAGVLGLRTPRRRDYPMPPMPDDPTRLALAAAADSRGWATTAIPFAINSVPREGRAACVRCSQCIGHACPVNAKNGTHNTFIPRALATGNAHLLTGSQAIAIEHRDGRASGVRIVTETPGGPIEHAVAATTVVVAAGALETPRLLLASGLGNSWVGRNHHSHGVAFAMAASAPAGIKSDLGPGNSIATLDFVHRDHEAWGGGVLFDMAAASYPIARAQAVTAVPATAIGLAHKNQMRLGDVGFGTMSMVQEIPHAAARISLDPSVRDSYGMPVVRATGRPTAATAEAVEYMERHAADWVAAAGGTGVSSIGAACVPQGTEHSAGTARLGSDPADAACDPRGLLFGTTNVYVADASLHPTNGGFNPALTVIANALRVARLMVEAS